jgi:hypothetical protein
MSIQLFSFFVHGLSPPGYAFLSSDARGATQTLYQTDIHLESRNIYQLTGDENPVEAHFLRTID